MKKAILIILINICLYSSTYCQTVYTSEKDVYTSKDVVFYGYDFSDFQLSDAKRMGQDVRKFILYLDAEFFSEHISDKKLKKRLEKDSIIYNFDPTILLNKKITNDGISSAFIHKICKDSLQSFINRYSITEKEGIGYVIIYECFDKGTKSASAYSVFFDIASRKILMTDYVSRYDSNSFNRIRDWEPLSIKVINLLLEKYSDRIEAIKKATKNI
jgi:hypothetical protein